MFFFSVCKWQNLPYWFGITSGSVSSPSGGSWSLINWWCRESLFTLVQLLIIGVETPHDGTVTVRVCCCVDSSWQSAGTTGNCVCFADLIVSSAFLKTVTDKFNVSSVFYNWINSMKLFKVEHFILRRNTNKEHFDWSI